MPLLAWLGHETFNSGDDCRARNDPSGAERCWRQNALGRGSRETTGVTLEQITRGRGRGRPRYTYSIGSRYWLETFYNLWPRGWATLSGTLGLRMVELRAS